MSNYLAIATVTATLRELLRPAVAAGVPGAVVTMQRPEAVATGAQHDPKVNLYMYQVMPNAAWRNHEITIRRAAPTATGDRGQDKLEYRQIVPLNLHYLLSCYGAENELEPQRLLGICVGLLQEQARLSIDAVRNTIQAYSYLQASDLPFQLEYIEHIQLTPIKLDLEEMSKIWSVFFQVPYALSVAYEASVVLIEPGKPRMVPMVTEPQSAVKQHNGLYLFSIDSALVDELAKTTASALLQNAFKEHTYPLSDAATIAPIVAGHHWLITDPKTATVFDAPQQYRVLRAEKGLDVYQGEATAAR